MIRPIGANDLIVEWDPVSVTSQILDQTEQTSSQDDDVEKDLIGQIVYSLFWKDVNNEDWHHISTVSISHFYDFGIFIDYFRQTNFIMCSIFQTTTSPIEVRGYHKSYATLTFKLLAITKVGVLAVSYPLYSSTEVECE